MAIKIWSKNSYLKIRFNPIFNVCGFKHLELNIINKLLLNIMKHNFYLDGILLPSSNMQVTKILS